MKQTKLPDFAEARGKSLLVALSGGADSVALLHMLHSAQRALNLTLFAVHIEHGIRGEESRKDAEFCRELCASLDIPFFLETIDVPTCAAQSGEGLETAARRLRYNALRRVRENVDADWIALAHHLDDQAETVLMHLLRGCGPNGVAGMRRLSGNLYRPLLSTPKSALVAYLNARGQPFRTDCTNLIPNTPRNVLRLHGLPALEESYPHASMALARYAEAAEVENQCMERLTDAFLQSRLQHGSYGFRLTHPEEADEAILRRAFGRVCGESLDSEKRRELAALCAAKRGKTDVSASIFAERTPSALYFLPKRPILPTPTVLSAQGRTSFEPLGCMEVRSCEAVAVRDKPFSQTLRRDALKNAVVRLRRDGDRIHPLGCGDKLLSDYLTDRKVDRPLRDWLPLVAVGNRVLWVVGLGIAEEAKLTGSNDDALRFEWIPHDGIPPNAL